MDLPLNARRSYLRRYDLLAYMQVTAAFARKSYLHLISLITPLLISISTLVELTNKRMNLEDEVAYSCNIFAVSDSLTCPDIQIS